MTKEERDALIARARKTPWIDAEKHAETEALIDALDEATALLSAWQERAWKALTALALARNESGDLDAMKRERAHDVRGLVDVSEAFLAISRDLAEARGHRDRAEKRAEAAERDLADARSQRAALYEVGARYIKTLGDGEWIALAHALDDADTAAREYEARVRAPVEAERDHLAHIIDNICGIAASPQIEHVEDAVRRLRDERDALATALAEMREHARVHGYAALATAPATDLAAQREARVRTDERGKALREAADALDPVDGNSREVDDIDDVPGWLRARAERSR